MKTLTITRGSGNPVELFRVLHDVEMGAVRRAAPAPEVFWLNEERTPFGRDWQLLSFALNPGMTGEKWRALYGFMTAFCNGSGFKDDDHPEADYVNNLDLSSPLPAFDKTRLCGGARVKGRVEGTALIVDIMDGNGPVPSLEWLLARPWLYFEAVIVQEDGRITRFPQN